MMNAVNIAPRLFGKGEGRAKRLMKKEEKEKEVKGEIRLIVASAKVTEK